MPIVRAADGTRLILKKGRSAELSDFVSNDMAKQMGETDFEAKKRRDNTPFLVAVADEVHNGEIYRFVPYKLAVEMTNKGEAVVIRKSDPDYARCMRLALGLPKGQVAQVRGHAVNPNDIRVGDFEALADQLEKESLAAQGKGSTGNLIEPGLPGKNLGVAKAPAARRGRPPKEGKKHAVPSMSA